MLQNESYNRARFPFVSPMNGILYDKIDPDLGNTNPAPGYISVAQPRTNERRPDTKYLGVTLIYVSAFLPLALWLMRSVYQSLPISLEEAAWLLGEDYEALMDEPLDAARARLRIADPVAYRRAQAELGDALSSYASAMKARAAGALA